MKNLYKKYLLLFLASISIIGGYSQQSISKDDALTQEFYTINHHQLYWFSSGKSLKRASEWLTILESSGQWGITTDKAKTTKIRATLLNRNALDGNYKEAADRQITGMVLDFLKELQEGNISFDYDEVSIPRDSLYINQLISAKHRETPSKLVARLDCKDNDYLILRKYLHDSVSAGDTLKYKGIVLAMNYKRYLAINHHPEYVLINIPETDAVYYRNNFPVLRMKTVVGRKKNPTPLIASYITSIVTFPHWNVPYTIAVKELLPKVQKNDNYLEQNNFEIVDAKGNPVDDSDLNWSDYDEKNFPYFFRQSTGAGNSLGVLKFNLQNPFSIFLHSTSSPGSFSKDFRFLSHGCIRLEQPFELADSLLRGNIDIAELRTGKKDTESKTIRLPEKVPVFIIYQPVKVVGERVTFLKDVYSLIK